MTRGADKEPGELLLKAPRIATRTKAGMMAAMIARLRQAVPRGQWRSQIERSLAPDPRHLDHYRSPHRGKAVATAKWNSARVERTSAEQQDCLAEQLGPEVNVA
jgi:hypothetical protein